MLIFGRAGTSLLLRLLSSCGERGLLSSCDAGVSPRGGCSCGAQALGTGASAVVAAGLSCSAERAIFPDQGPNESPALAGGLLPTVPPGKAFFL